MTKREEARWRRLRRDPFGRLAVAIGDYLETVGWTLVVAGSPEIRQTDRERLGNFEFVVKCTGGRTLPKTKESKKRALRGAR